ncbi:acylase [Polymorphobacter arshaanensis]|uniref:Acylase n=1 Tax=Glacieibacterium arshaanense TaxID=2511025 RepID=A0A4Y9ERM4_9SPHN|nr:acylase [Polymorphobacter arshaanensis]TFU06102.1 acylase [Polymorphobacter arshaanensis]
MHKALKAMLFGGGALAVTAIALASWEGLLAPQSVADPLVKHDVRIVRDSWGVPHIFGKTDADVAYGLAYAHAEDDFGTIAETLAMVRGRAGAMLGPDGAKFDYVGHLLDARTVADKGYMTQLSPDTRALVEAYAAGLNKYAVDHPEEVPMRALFPVNGRDIVAGFALRSPFFFGLDRVLGPLTTDKLPPRDSGPGEQRGSNAFAIAGKRSGDGVTRLLSNSHQPWVGGVAWYEVVVHSDAGWDFAGALFPGMPYPALGHNNTLGWTNTVNRADLIDTYKLVLDASGDNYRYDGQWRPLERHRVWLPVRFGPFVIPVPRTVARSVQGPVIENKLGAFAVRYAGMGDVRQVEQYYRLNKARDFAEWQRVMAMQAVPATNFVYADAAGNIGMFYNARFPQRAPGFDWKGVLPGDTSKAVWKSYVPFAGYPQVINPPSGWVANSNNTPFIATAPGDNLDASKFAPELGIETFITNRAMRFQSLFAALGDAPIGRDALLSIKFDKAYDRASWAGKRQREILALDFKDAPDLAKAQKLLSTWDFVQDGQGDADALAAVMVNSVSMLAYFGDAMPDAREDFTAQVKFLNTAFGRLDPPLATLQRVQRGNVDLGVLGGPEVLRAIHSRRDEKLGRLVGQGGDSFIMLVEWGAAGKTGAGTVSSESIVQFGAATSREASPHYNDQAKLFVAEKFKPNWLTANTLAPHTESDRRP